MGLQERDGEAALVSSASINNLETDQEGRSTLIKLELPYSGAGVGLGDGDSYQDIDRCCPASNLSQWEDFVRVSLQSPGLYIDSMTSRRPDCLLSVRGPPCVGLRPRAEQVPRGEGGEV